MTTKDKLNQLSTAWTSLNTKIKTKLTQQDQALKQAQNEVSTKQTKLNEQSQLLEQANHKLELSAKENSENEKVLEQLLKEFKELEKELG